MEVILHTNGTSLWSNAAKAVKITALKVPYVNDERDFGELRVYFDTATWNINESGLIYTDELFEKELAEFLSTMGLDGSDVDYSEQGMQGDDYVSCDVGGDFLKSWIAMGGEVE
jgi:hypothetical protein